MPEPTDDLTSWLREQLDEYERLAHAVLGADASSWDPYGYLPGEKRDYLVLYSPAYVLAEVDAKRRILDEHPPVPEPYGLAGHCERCVDPEAGGPDPAAVYPCTTVRLLALPFADRDGFREEWKP